MSDKAECRGCGMELIGEPDYKGGEARHPVSNKLCDRSFWGGFVCSDICDYAVDERQNRSIDAHHDPIGYYS